jgi:hypothetical protein
MRSGLSHCSNHRVRERDRLPDPHDLHDQNASDAEGASLDIDGPAKNGASVNRSISRFRSSLMVSDWLPAAIPDSVLLRSPCDDFRGSEAGRQ